MCDGTVLIQPGGGYAYTDMLGPPSAHLKNLQPDFEQVQKYLNSVGVSEHLGCHHRLLKTLAR